MNKLLCTHFDEDDSGVQIYPPCLKPATHYSCCNGPKEQVLNACEEHRCRCKQPNLNMIIKQL
jgi:hypothetical protein